jgi:hypothetical protein
MKLQQVMILYAKTEDMLSPTSIKTEPHTNFTILPQEQIVVAFKNQVPPCTFKRQSKSLLCYLIKNTSKVILQCRGRIKFDKLLKHDGIQHTMINLSVNHFRKLQKRWLRGCKVWYPLRRKFVASNLVFKKYHLI